MLSFKQFDFQPTDDFEPSKETKEFWLYTKKSKSNFSGIELPGLFGTSGYAVSMAAFVCIFILEGLATTYGVEFDNINLIAVLSSIILDIILAIISHLWHAKICRLKNELTIAEKAVEQEYIKRKLNSLKISTNFFYLLILISGAFKILMYSKGHYLVLEDKSLDPIMLGASACYLVAALLHIFYTGYFLFTSRFNFLIAKDYDSYIESKGEKNRVHDDLKQPINTDNTNIKIIEYAAGKHSIVKESDGKYYFKTHGVLLDTELNALIGVQQNPISQTIIAREGLKQQIRILNINLTNKQ